MSSRNTEHTSNADTSRVPIADTAHASIKSYDQVRSMLRFIFLYGCYPKGELPRQLAFGKEAYKKKMYALKKYIPKENIISTRVGRKKVDKIRSESFKTTYNTLFDSYMTKAFGRGSVCLALQCLQILGESEAGLTLKAVIDELDSARHRAVASRGENDDYIGEIDSRTVRNKMNELADSGYVRILSDETRAEKVYCTAPDLFSGFSGETRRRLLTAVDFFRNITYPAVCGDYLFRTLNQYEESLGNEESYHTPFVFAHNLFVSVLDDQILWNLLQAMDGRHRVSLSYENQKGEKRKAGGVIPLFIQTDERLGRRHLIALPGKSGGERYRLDRIAKAGIERDGANGPDLEEKIETARQQYLKRPAQSRPLRLMVRSETALEQLEEMYVTAERSGDAKAGWEVVIRVEDANTIKYWLRQHLDDVALLSDEGSGISKAMEEEMTEWRAMYGLVL